MARKQQTGLSKVELQALADANNVEYTQNTTNPDLEDLLTEAGVDLQSAEEAPQASSSGDEVRMTGSPASSSGTAIEGEPVPAITSRAQPAPALTIDDGADSPQDQPATPRSNVAAAVAPAVTAGTPAGLADIDREELMRARQIIDQALAVSTGGAATDMPTDLERAKDLPYYHEHPITLSEAAGMLDIEEDQVLPGSVRVRQHVDNAGKPYGEAWVTLVDVNGRKYAKQL